MPCLCGCHFPLHRHFQQYMACNAPQPENLQWRSAPRKITYTFVTATIDGKAHSNRKNAGKLAPISFSDVQRP
jgi:hypothetical protein